MPLKTAAKAVTALTVGCLLFFSVLSLAFSATQNVIFSIAFTIIAMSNALLIVVLTRVWLVKKYPAVERWLERIPGISFGTPVPEHIRAALSPSVSAVDPQPEIQHSPAPAVVRRDRTPFTLGTLEFEPPEPIPSMHLPVPEVEEIGIENVPPLVTSEPMPVLNQVVTKTPKKTVEKAFLKTAQRAKTLKRDEALNRLHDICRLLKQANLEVAVWTERELATLATTMLGPKSDDKDMIALLLPQNVLKVNSDRTFEFEYHAQVLNQIVLATGRQVGIAFVNSQKTESSGQCEVNFDYQGVPKTWRFVEEHNKLSDVFLRKALAWVGQRASGKFFELESNERSQSYVFIPTSVLLSLRSTETHEVA